jgi:hypothetical protein
MKTIAALTGLLILLAGCASAPPRLNEPVVLKAGETRAVGSDGFGITLRHISEDSGCLSSTDCSTMIFNGSIVASLGDRNHLIQAGAVLRPGQWLKLDFDGYEFALTDVRRNERNQLQATFIVLGRSGEPDKDK